MWSLYRFVGIFCCAFMAMGLFANENIPPCSDFCTCSDFCNDNAKSRTPKSDKHSLLLLYENDSNFNPHIDRYYTAGVALKFHSKDLLPNQTSKHRTRFYAFMNAISLPSFFAKYLQKYDEDTLFAPSFGIAMSQEIYAPKDKFSNPPPSGDYPYSGFLYTSVVLQNRFKYIVEQFEAQIGVVGKAALAKQTQDFIHEARNVRKLEGWDTQLKNEGVFNMYYHLSFSLPKVYEKSKSLLDIMPQASFGLGNAKIYAQANLIARIGYNLTPNTFAPTINSGFVSAMQHSFDFSIEAYAGVGIRAVVRNMFLQGNSFLPRNDIDLSRGVGEFIWGVSLNYKRFFVAYTALHHTREFSNQDGGGGLSGIHTIGSIIVGGNF